MKKLLVIAVASATVFACTGVAINISNDRKAQAKAQETSQVSSLKSQLKESEQAKEARVSALEQAGAQINVLTQKTTALSQTNAALCAQIRTARLNQPLCR
jgi:hypothetical protein